MVVFTSGGVLLWTVWWVVGFRVLWLTLWDLLGVDLIRAKGLA